MPSLSLQLQSLFFKYHLRHQLQTLTQTRDKFGTTSRPDHPSVPANPTFQNGVATKDLHIDPLSSLSLRIFLPETVLLKDSAFDSSNVVYGGYTPPAGKRHRKLPIMLQFHGGGFVVGSNDTSCNDLFCRRMAKLCDVIVVAVGYRLAPESPYPAAFEDGTAVLSWLAKQANLAAVRRKGRGNSGNQQGIFDSFGSSMVEPWLAAHGEPSRYLNCFLPDFYSKMLLNIGV